MICKLREKVKNIITFLPRIPGDCFASLAMTRILEFPKNTPAPTTNGCEAKKILTLYTSFMYNSSMIKSFADKVTKLAFDEIFSKKLPSDIQKIALRKLLMLSKAKCLNDLRMPPSNHLEKLQGSRSAQHSIRINDKWRICFRLENENDFCDVEITDYH